MKDEPCQECKTGKMYRHYVVNEMVEWVCDNVSCASVEYENFCDMNDEGWTWLRKYYEEM